MTEGTMLTPLSIVMAFISIIEATLAFRVTKLQGKAQMIFVWFMVTFPVVVLIGFFVVQITNPISWYPPSELNKTTIDNLKFLSPSQQKMTSVEFIHASDPSKSQTIGSIPPTSSALDFYKEGKYEQALDWFKIDSVTQEQIPPAQQDFPLIAQTQTNIGVTLSSIGRYSEAEKAFQRALEIYRKINDITGIAVVLNNLASVYKNSGNLQAAEKTYDQSIKHISKYLGPEHPDAAVAYNNLGSVYAAMGKYDKALVFFQKSISLHQKTFGNENPQTVATMNNIGTMFQEKGDYSKALEYYEKALEINKKILGEDNPATKVISENISKLKKGS